MNNIRFFVLGCLGLFTAGQSFPITAPVRCGTFQPRPLARGAAISAQKTFTYAGGFVHVQYDTFGAHAVPDSDASTLTATGFAAGADGVPDYVQFVAQGFDSAHHHITGALGYSYPHTSVNIRMHDLGYFYGYAINEDSLEIDNDLGFFSPESVDIRSEYQVTAAHEFYHCVQFGYSSNFNFFHEASAVWMEEETYPQVNDYLQYLESPDSSAYERNIFFHPDFPLDGVNAYSPGNYDKMVWPLFLARRFSRTVNRFAWEEYGKGRTNTALIFDTSLAKAGSALAVAGTYAEFSRWMFYTGARALLRPGFEDADTFPLIRIDTLDMAGLTSRAMTLRPLSMQYFYLKGVASGVQKLIAAPSNPNGKALGIFYSILQGASLAADSSFAVSDTFEFSLSPAAGRNHYIAFTNASDVTLQYALFKNQISVEQPRRFPVPFAVEVFPNPGQGAAFLRLSGMGAGAWEISLNDVLGRRVWRQSGETPVPLEWRLPQLPAGLYGLQVKSRKGEAAKRIVILP